MRAADVSATSVVSNPLPNLGDGAEMTPSAERKLGDRIARAMERDPDYLDDPVIGDFVQSVWLPLLAASRARGELTPELDAAYAWRLLLLRDRTVNAFALPGGYFGLHLGLVGMVTSRDELASVLAHEMSHVTQRHIARNMSHQAAQSPWVMGAMILGVLAAAKSPDAANAVLMGSQAGAVQSQLNYSRGMEREADRIGFGVMSEAGYEPMGFVTMFDKLQQAMRLNDLGGFPYLRTHPLTTERIADMQARIVPLQAGQAPHLPLQDFEQAMVAARARVLADSSVDALRTVLEQAQPGHLAALTPPQRVGALYGATLAAMRVREFTNAVALWQRTSAAAQAQPHAAQLARLLGAEMYLAQNDAVSALAVLSVLGSDVAPYERSALFLTATAAAQSAPGPLLERLAQSLQVWTSMHASDAQAWQLLGSVYAAQGRTLSAIRAQAESDAARMDYESAQARFKAAQDWVRQNGAQADGIEAAIVDARARQMASMVREQALER